MKRPRLKYPVLRWIYRPHTTRASVQVQTASSPARIVEQTPTLKRLYELLARPLP